jgi:hypothetical protein
MRHTNNEFRSDRRSQRHTALKVINKFIPSISTFLGPFYLKYVERFALNANNGFLVPSSRSHGHANSKAVFSECRDRPSILLPSCSHKPIRHGSTTLLVELKEFQSVQVKNKHTKAVMCLNCTSLSYALRASFWYAMKHASLSADVMWGRKGGETETANIIPINK